MEQDYVPLTQKMYNLFACKPWQNAVTAFVCVRKREVAEACWKILLVIKGLI